MIIAERPIREFEIPSENVTRWSSEGNTFAVKQTRLANLLAQSVRDFLFWKLAW